MEPRTDKPRECVKQQADACDRALVRSRHIDCELIAAEALNDGRPREKLEARESSALERFPTPDLDSFMVCQWNPATSFSNVPAVSTNPAF